MKEAGRRTLKFKIILISHCVCFALVSPQVEAQLAEGKCKFIGNIISGNKPSDFTTYWNQVTPENGGKWESVEATRDVMTWTALDLAYNTAKDNGFSFKQHTFVWGQQQPGWITALSATEQREEVEEWIQAFGQRYPDTDFIDVVNEPLHAPPAYASALGGNGTTGWDWVIWSFEEARLHCPNAKLILNDYNIINNNAATDAFLVIINLLKARNLIDGIGEQGHFLEETPNATLTANLNKLHATGIPIYISEYDVNILDDEAQRAKYQEQFPILWTHPGVRGITLWGYIQNQIWRPNAYLIRSTGTKRPALTWLQSYVPASAGGTFCNPVTGLDEHESQIRAYPNPADNGNFKLEVGRGKHQVQIIDVHGRVSQDLGTTSQESIDIRIETPGIYLIKITRDRTTSFKKIIID